MDEQKYITHEEVRGKLNNACAINDHVVVVYRPRDDENFRTCEGPILKRLTMANGNAHSIMKIPNQRGRIPAFFQQAMPFPGSDYLYCSVTNITNPENSVATLPTTTLPHHAHPKSNICDGRFVIHLDEELGRGGFGVVYKGYENKTQKIVAIKEAPCPSEKTRAAIVAEFDLLTTLVHPHIVSVIALHENPSSQQLYIIMEYASGSVASKVGYCSDLALVCQYVRHALRGLAYLHESRVLHRDMKPGNMLLFSDGTLKLADFGLSKELKSSFSMDTVNVAGTPAYLSHEAIRGHFSIGSDLWALGCAVLEIVSGCPPWSELDLHEPLPLMFAIGTAVAPHHHPALPDVALSPPMAAFFEKVFSYEARDRGTASELLELFSA